jgi:uncharacterized protein (DUF1499 family)
MPLFLSWFTRNWADTDEGSDPAVVPVDLSLPPAAARVSVENAIGTLPRWQVKSIDTDALEIKAERRTRLFRFVDDITIRLEALGDGGTRVHARSQSRLGKGDFGQNRRNLLELLRLVRKL